MRFVLSIAALLALVTPLSAQFSSSSSAPGSSSTGGAVSSPTGVPASSSTGQGLSSSSGTFAPSSSSSAFFGASSSSSGPAKPSLTPEQSNDLAVLNTALTVAHLKASFFGCQLFPLNSTYDFCANQTVTTFSVTDFEAAGFNSSVFQAFEIVALHSVEHVQLLTQVIGTLDASAAVPRCAAYNYQRTGSVPASSPQTFATFMAGAQSLSSSSASIHLGALPGVTSRDLINVVAGLTATEARHSSYFVQLSSFAPFVSSGFDTPVSATQASLILQSWMLSCSGVSFTLPTVRPYGIALNTANITNQGYAQGTLFTGSLSEANGLRYTPEQRVNDVLTLNYLLFIENFQNALFNASATQWNVTDFASQGFNETVYELVQDMASNDLTHASMLRTMITMYDNRPANESINQSNNQCVYNFTSVLRSADTFSTVLSALKQWSASAYIGVSNSLTDTGLQAFVGSITTIEARHSAIANLIASGNRAVPLSTREQPSAFPVSVDAALTPGQAIDQLRALNFVVSCSANLTLPAIAPLVIPVPGDNSTLSSSTGAFVNQSSSSGAFVNTSSSSGAFVNVSSSSGVFVNGSSSTGIIGNVSSSSGAFFNGSSSSGGFVNVTSSSGAFGNVSSSSGMFANSSSSGAFVNVSSSSGAFVNVSSSSGAFGNFSSSSGSFGNNTSSTGAFNSSTGSVSSTVNFTSSSTGAARSSSSSSVFDNLSSSIRSSSSSASPVVSSSSTAFPISSSSSPAAFSSTGTQASSSTGVIASSSSTGSIFDSSSDFPVLSSSGFDLESSTGGDDIEDPGLNSASSIQHITTVVAMTVAAAIFVM